MYAIKNGVLCHMNADELAHYGVIGMKWGVRRYQNKDGTLTNAGQKLRELRRAGLDASSEFRRSENERLYSRNEGAAGKVVATTKYSSARNSSNQDLIDYENQVERSLSDFKRKASDLLNVIADTQRAVDSERDGGSYDDVDSLSFLYNRSKAKVDAIVDSYKDYYMNSDEIRYIFNEAEIIFRDIDDLTREYE